MSYGWNRDAPPQRSATDLANSFLNSVKQEIQEAPYGHEPHGHIKEEYDDYRRKDRDNRDRYHGSRDRYYDRSRDNRDNKRRRSRDRRDRSPRDRHRGGRDDRDFRRRRSVSPHRSNRRRSPRRRSPSPRHRDENVIPLSKRERKLHNWDLAPAGMEGLSAQQVKSTGLFPLPGQVLGTRAPQSFQAPPPSSSHHMEYSHGAPPKHQIRIYVGQIPYNIPEAPLADFFNKTMENLHFANGPCVSSVTLNHDKNYAFVDFETPEQATHAMGFDGIMFQGHQLKIRRPKDYQPPTQGELEPALVPGLVSTNVANTPNKIFIGGIPLYLTDDQVLELLKSFGELRSFNLVKDTSNGQNKGFAFCEYMDPNVTDLACEGLNNMELGDRKLIVQRASIGAKHEGFPTDYMTHVPLTAADYLPINGASEEEATRVLQLMNMVTPEELEDEDEYKDIWEDIAEECSKFGTIVDMKIPRPNHGENVPGLGLIFIRYETKDQTLAALNSLAGRKFADRTVVATFIDEDNYLSDNF